MVRCVWLPTLEHSADRPSLYERFGTQNVGRRARLGYASLQSFWPILWTGHPSDDLYLPSTKVTHHALGHPSKVDRDVEARGYQLEALASALAGSTMTVMPTGFGKSAVEWMVIAHHLHNGGKVLLPVPTVALLAQHQRMLQTHLVVDEEDVVMFTGQTPPAKRPELWTKGKIILATAQVVRNDATSGSIELGGLSLSSSMRPITRVANTPTLRSPILSAKWHLCSGAWRHRKPRHEP